MTLRLSGNVPVHGTAWRLLVNCWITAEHLQSSYLYYKIADRIDMLPLLESIIDSNDTIFKYNHKLNAYSVIKADYIMKNKTEGRNIFLFLAENGEEGRYFCRSFFP